IAAFGSGPRNGWGEGGRTGGIRRSPTTPPAPDRGRIEEADYGSERGADRVGAFGAPDGASLVRSGDGGAAQPAAARARPHVQRLSAGAGRVRHLPACGQPAPPRQRSPGIVARSRSPPYASQETPLGPYGSRGVVVQRGEEVGGCADGNQGS